jgi:predicted TPR repeat methyltransferase
VSADTLCYFGALETPLSGVASALQPGGLVVFTAERARDDAVAYQLNPSGGHSHAEDYVRDAVAAAMLSAPDIVPVVLRREGGHEVSGFLVSARRRA